MSHRGETRRTFLHKTAALGAAGAGLAGNALYAATDYLPTWESLDSHPCPAWFKDAKFGMYFHWGVCSVPGWAPRKWRDEDQGISYAEWYWHSMMNENDPTWRYHRETYGDNFSYDDFIPLFTAEHYDPVAWAKFAKQVGAQYIFVNTKHHDGFCHWPSRYTNRNSAMMGPKRDLTGPFVEAARREGLKVGFYYSYYEWYNPLYTGRAMPYAGLIPVDDFVDDFMIPQIHEFIDLYHPDFLYFDGEWDHPTEFWKSREFVAYYYNQARERSQEVLVNDRFGRNADGTGSRGKHGDVYNVEYHFGSEIEGLLTHKWSYWRGIAKTFGYNRDTDPEDCLTPKELITMFVDGVSKNGNFDINVGPTADGIITEVEKRPLIALGEWLAVNGEAIYGTRVHEPTEEGDIRFTAKGDTVYAIFLKNQGDTFRIRSLRAVEGSKITLLGVPGSLTWRQDANGLTIEYPAHKSRPTKCAYAWAFKIRTVR